MAIRDTLVHWIRLRLTRPSICGGAIEELYEEEPHNSLPFVVLCRRSHVKRRLWTDPSLLQSRYSHSDPPMHALAWKSASFTLFTEAATVLAIHPKCGEQGEGIASIILASLQANIRRYDAPLQIPSLLLPFRQYNTHTSPFFIELSDEKMCLIAPYQQAHPPREVIFPCDTFPISKVATQHPSNRHIQVPPPYLESSIILVVFKPSYIRASVILIASTVHFMASEAQTAPYFSLADVMPA
ncbi:hypothetical protein ARMGADRAFT_1035670 [Armillaria gallica]|uniref:Uncharacterized protein n=1 Tax=Armillaria gallica TaxID=47427 RepID=A0A2H3DD89_ARMGA|nr:hypothetical protein ARMGADRAFT_1035670 [Armillaria gallica]